MLAALILTVAVTVQAASVKLSATKLSMTVGQTKTLRINTKGSVKWRSSDKSVVSVTAKGKVRAKKAGKATVTAVTGGRKLRCSVTVKNAKNSSKSLAAYFAYSENIGDTSSMSVDAVTSASLNEDTRNKQGNIQLMAGEIREKKALIYIGFW